MQKDSAKVESQNEPQPIPMVTEDKKKWKETWYGRDIFNSLKI